MYYQAGIPLGNRVQHKAAIVGAGLMGIWHAHAVRRAGVKLSAVIDRSSAAGSKLASRYRARYFSDLDSFLGDNTCDAVHICTPAATHFSLAMRALDAGCNVLVEKPLTLSGPESLALAEKAERKGKLLCPVHQFPFQRGFAAILAELKNRSNPPLGISFYTASAGAGDCPDEHLNPLILEMLPHPLSVLAEIWPQTGTDQLEWTISWPRNGEMIAQGRHANIPVFIRISLHARPTRCTMNIQHQDGSMEYDFFHGYAVFDSPRVSRSRKITGPFNHSVKVMSAATLNLLARFIRQQWAYPGLESLVRKFYAGMEDGSAPVEPAMYLAIAQTCDYFKRHLPEE